MPMILSTMTRENLELDGVTYEVRPLTGGEKVRLGVGDVGNRILFAVARCLTGITGVVIDGRKAVPSDYEYLPKEHITALAVKISAISGLSEDDRKNSESSPASGPGSSTNGPESGPLKTSASEVGVPPSGR